MHLWRKLAEPRWLRAHENILQARSCGKLATISRPGRKLVQLEVACLLLDDSRKLVEEFGGRAEKWPRDWLKRFADLDKSKPLKIGKRLLISNVQGQWRPVSQGTNTARTFSFQLLPLSGQEDMKRRQCRFVSSNA